MESSPAKQRMLRDEFGLTPTDIQTLEYLVQGNSPADIAQLTGLKASSVRQRLKQIYKKTGVSGQVHLIAFYSGL